MVKLSLKELFLVTSLVSLCAGSSSPVLAMQESDFSEAEKPRSVSSQSPIQTQKKINDVVVSTATKVYEKINTNWHYVDPHSQMQTESTMWEPKWIVGLSLIDGEKQETRIPTLILKTSPDKLIEALEDLITKPASLECTIALTTAKIFCLREILGQDYFNRYTTAFYRLLETREDWDVEQFFHELPLQFLTNLEGKAIPGSITYVTNIPLYPYFKPHGNGRGSNLICTGLDHYLGFSA
ncbi:MAG TPA: hypothetical protein VMW10_07450, partial [Alphaproteobacteria bacterium]|nr:hypothetical protein [Alphaproteobacteria bacterium]